MAAWQSVLFLLYPWTFQYTYVQGNLVTGILDKLLPNFKEGTLELPNMELGPNNRVTDIKVYLNDFVRVLEGVDSFGFTLNAAASNIHISGNYDIESLEIPQLFPIYGKGEFLVHLHKIHTNLTLQADMNATTDKFDITIPAAKATVNSSTVYFENLMNDPNLADFLNELLSFLVPDVLAILGDLLNYLQPAIDYFGNECIICIKRHIFTGKIEECIKNITLPAMSTPLNTIKLS